MPLDALSVSDLTTGSPVLGEPVLSHGYVFSATALTTGVPIIAEPVLTQGHVFSVADVAAGAPVFGVPSLGLDQHSLWPFRPNWNRTVVQEFSFKTDVFSSRSNREQRRSLRERPRKKWEFGSMVYRDRFRESMAKVTSRFDSTFHLLNPIYTVSITLPVALFDDTVVVSEPPLWIYPGAIVGLTHRTAEWLTRVVSVNGNQIVLAGAADTEWPAGARLHLVETIHTENLRVSGETSEVITLQNKLHVDPEHGLYFGSGAASVYFLLDRSASLSTTEFSNIKTAVNAGLDLIERFIETSPDRIDVGVRFYSSGSVAIERTDCDLADLDDIRAFIAGAARVTGGDVFTAMGFVESWFTNSLSVRFSKRSLIFVTDTNTEDGMTAAAAGPAADMLDQNSGVFSVENGTPVDMYAVNYVSTNTTWTALLDNTPEDGIPIISSANTSGLTAAVAAGLPPSVTEQEWFEDREVFLQEPNWREAVEFDYETMRESVDYEQGQIAYFTPVPYVLRKQRAAFLGRNLEDTESILNFFVRMRGRLNEFYMPTGMNDIVPIEALVGGDNKLKTSGRSYYIAFNSQTLTDSETVLKAMILYLADGTHVIREIADVILDGNDSLFTVTPVWSSSVSLAQIKKISFLPVCRFAGDTLAVEWETNRVAQFALTIQALETL